MRFARSRGLSAGDRVVVALANGPLFIATLTAILAREASPLLVHSKTPATELRAMPSDSARRSWPVTRRTTSP